MRSRRRPITRTLTVYQQGERETQFADYEHIPGLNWGGWHDAGDYDLPAGSISNTMLALALAQEEFHPGIDMTTVRRATREVLLHIPDGEDDLLQQVEYGVEGLMGVVPRLGPHLRRNHRELAGPVRRNRRSGEHHR